MSSTGAIEPARKAVRLSAFWHSSCLMPWLLSVPLGLALALLLRTYCNFVTCLWMVPLGPVTLRTFLHLYPPPAGWRCQPRSQRRPGPGAHHRFWAGAVWTFNSVLACNSSDIVCGFSSTELASLLPDVQAQPTSWSITGPVGLCSGVEEMALNQAGEHCAKREFGASG